VTRAQQVAALIERILARLNAEKERAA